MTSKDWPLLEFEYRQEEKQCLRPVDRHVETAGSLGESYPPGDADLDRGASVRRSELCKVLRQPRMVLDRAGLRGWRPLLRLFRDLRLQS